MARKKKAEIDGIDGIPSLPSTKVALETKGLHVVDPRDWGDPDCISTGSFLFDCLLDGGIRVPSIVQFYGEESSGKTTLALEILKQAYKKGYKCWYVSLEKYNPSLAISMGIDFDKVTFITHEGSAEDMLETVHHQILQTRDNVVVIDSVPCMVPRQSMEKGEGKWLDPDFARLPAILGAFFSKTSYTLSANNCTLILINHVRSKLSSRFNPDPSSKGTGQYRVPGGWHLRHALEYNFEVVGGNTSNSLIREADSKDTDMKFIGHYVTITIKKSKWDASRHKCVAGIPLISGKGVDQTRELLSYGIANSLISKKGAWFEWNGEKFHGEEKLRVVLEDQEHLKKKLMEEIKHHLETVCQTKAPLSDED